MNPAAVQAQPSQDARLWAMLEHISSLIGFMVPLGSIVAPLVIYVIKAGDDPFIARNGRAVLNFQLSMLIYFVLAFALWVIACFLVIVKALPPKSPEQVTWIVLPVYFSIVIIGAALFVFDVAMVVHGAVSASRGQLYRYWLALPFLRV